MQKLRTYFIGFILIILVICLINLFRSKNGTSTPPQASPSLRGISATPTQVFYQPPPGWKHYVSTLGFSYWYPAGWVNDDSEITQFSTLHSAFSQYSNQLTVSKTQTKIVTGDIMPNPPEITFTIASYSDLSARIHHTFTSSQSWANASSTGLPPGATVGTLLIQNEPATRLSNLSVVKGNYQAIYWLDTAHNATVQFNYQYDSAADVQILDSIAQSFSFSSPRN